MAEPLRILHVAGDLGVGGIQSFLLNLYRHIDKSKVQFDFVLHMKPERNHEKEITDSGGRIFHVDDDAFVKKNAIRYLRFWREFLKRHPEYPIVHGHLRSVSALYLWEAKRAGRVTIMHSHSDSNGFGLSAKMKDVFQFPARYLSDYCMGCSQRANEWMFGKKRAASNTCKVIPNAIDTEQFRFNSEARAKIRASFGYATEDFLIGTVGRLAEVKNQRVLIDAMPAALANRPEAKLLIVGDGPLETALKRRVAELRLENAVQIPGAREDVPDLLSAMDAFALCSRYEGLGIAAIEAQASGLPTLLSGAVPKEAFISEFAVCVDKNDATAWADAFSKLRVKPAERGTGAAEAIRKAGYDMKETSRRLTDFYFSVCNEKKGGL